MTDQFHHLKRTAVMVEHFLCWCAVILGVGEKCLVWRWERVGSFRCHVVLISGLGVSEWVSVDQLHPLGSVLHTGLKVKAQKEETRLSVPAAVALTEGAGGDDGAVWAESHNLALPGCSCRFWSFMAIPMFPVIFSFPWKNAWKSATERKSRV